MVALSRLSTRSVFSVLSQLTARSHILVLSLISARSHILVLSHHIGSLGWIGALLKNGSL